MADGRVVISTELDSQGAIDGMHDMEREMEQSGSTVASSADKTSNKIVNTFSSGLSNVKSLLGSVAKMAIAAFSVGALVNFGKQAVDVASDLTEVQNVVDTAFGNMSYKMENFAQTAVKTYGISELTAKQTASTYMAMANGLGLSADEASDMAITLTGLTADMASFYNVSQDVADTAIKSVFTGETESLKQFGIVMTQTNLQQFALSQGIKTNIQDMTQAQQVQLRYAYVMQQTTLAQGDFAKTSGNFANQVRVLKEQWSQLLGILGQGIIQVITPIVQGLNVILTYLIQIAKYLAKVFGFNMSTESEGVNKTAKSTKDLASSTNDLAKANKQNAKATKKAAKVAKGAVASFDELNVITTSTASGTKDKDTTGTGATVDVPTGTVGSMLPDVSSENAAADQLIAIFDKLKQKFNEIKKLFMEGFKIGLGDNWQESVSNIKSDIKGIGKALKDIFTDPGVQTAASDLVKSLITTLGKITGSAVSIGLTLAENLIGGIKKYLDENKGYIKKSLIGIFDANKEISEKVGDISVTVADIFSVFRGEKAKQITANMIAIFTNAQLGIAEICSKIGRDAITLISTAITENKEKIKTAIENTLEPLETITTTLKDGVTNTFKKINKMYDEHIKPLWDDVTDGFTTITGDILDVYNTYFAPVLKKLSAKFKEVWEEAIQPTLNKATDLIGVVADAVDDFWKNILSPAIDWIVKNVLPKLAPILEALGNLVGDMTKTIVKVIGDTIDVIKGVITFLTGVFTGDWKKAWKGIIDIFKGIFNGIKDIVTGVWDVIKDGVKLVGTAISGAFSVAVKAIKDVFGSIGKWFKENVWDNIKQVFSNVKDWFSEKFSAAWKAITGVFDNVKKWFTDNVWSKIKDVFTNVKDWFSDKFSTAWKAIKDVFANVKKWFAENVWQKVKDVFDNVKEWFSTKFSGAWTGIKNAFSNVKTFFSGIWKNIKDVFGNVASWFKEKFSAAWEAVKNVFSTGGKVFTGIKDGILNGLKAVINALIKGINKIIKIPFDGLNKALQKVKSIKILGAKPFNFLPTISVPQIPKLATGAVLPANKPFLSVVGDQRHGTNIEAPLDTIKQALLEVITQQGQTGTGDIVINIDGKEVFRVVQKQAKDYTNRTGKFAF